MIRPVKKFLEHPVWVWFFLCCGMAAVFGLWVFPDLFGTGHGASQRFAEILFSPFESARQGHLALLEGFGREGVPPSVDRMRGFSDAGHLGYYLAMGAVASWLHYDPLKLHWVHFATVALALLAFVQAGYYFTYKNRLSPVWVSGALLVLGLNPTTWWSAMAWGEQGLLLATVCGALVSFGRENFFLSSALTVFAVLLEPSSLSVAVAMILSRFSEEQGRILRPGRIFGFLAPLLALAFLALFWRGLVPDGDPRRWMEEYVRRGVWFQAPAFFYSLAVLAVATPWFSWNWALKARRHALMMGAGSLLLGTVLYFLFPLGTDGWAEIQFSSSEVLRGPLHWAVRSMSGEYQQYLLFPLALFGFFLFVQALLADVLERSLALRWSLVFWLALGLIIPWRSEIHLTVPLALALLFSLSESYVGEEGKLSGLSGSF